MSVFAQVVTGVVYIVSLVILLAIILVSLIIHDPTKDERIDSKYVLGTILLSFVPLVNTFILGICIYFIADDYKLCFSKRKEHHGPSENP